MIRPIGSLAPLLLCLAACGSETPVAPTDPVGSSPDHPEWGQSLYENGSTKEQFQFYLDQDREIKHGVYRAFYQSGSPQEEGFYKEGRKDSLWSYFNERGHTTLTHSWREGQRWNGPFRLYWPNGNPSEYGTYRKGQWHGAYSSYYPSGKTKISARYVDNQLHGIYIELYESGNRKIMGSYSRGLKTRSWIYYAESGVELQREEYESGEITSTERIEFETFADGSIKSIIPLRDDRLHGRETLQAGLGTDPIAAAFAGRQAVARQAGDPGIVSIDAIRVRPGPVDDDEVSWAFLPRERGEVTGVRRWIEQARALGQRHGATQPASALEIEHMNVHRGQPEA